MLLAFPTCSRTRIFDISVYDYRVNILAFVFAGVFERETITNRAFLFYPLSASLSDPQRKIVADTPYPFGL